MIKIWLDDLRKAKKDWITIICAEDAIALLKEGIVKEISLDHDLGLQKTGYDVINWIEKEVMTKGFNPPIIHIHTDNPVGRKAMKVVAERIKKYKRNLKGIKMIERSVLIERLVEALEDVSAADFIDEINRILGTDYTIDDVLWDE